MNVQIEKQDTEKGSWCACGHTKDNSYTIKVDRQIDKQIYRYDNNNDSAVDCFSLLNLFFNTLQNELKFNEANNLILVKK